MTDQKNIYSKLRLEDTRFNLFIRYKRDANGREYTKEEREGKAPRNQKPYPSYDYHLTKAGSIITDHRYGLEVFRKKIDATIKADNLISGYIKAVREQVVVFTFGADGVYRIVHHPHFKQVDSANTILEYLIRAKANEVVNATQKALVVDSFEQMNEQIAKFKQRSELYQEKTAQQAVTKLSDKLNYLRNPKP